MSDQPATKEERARALPAEKLSDRLGCVANGGHCPDCGCDPNDHTLHAEGCRRIFERGDPREDLQFGPPYKPWREAIS